MEILIITGPPYSGKGTQCEILEAILGFKHISTGEKCRLEKEKQTEIGIILSEYEERGDLVPDTIMKKLFSQIIEENLNVDGIILDGYPRTVDQVKDLISLTDEKSLSIKKVINISVPKNELLKRAEIRAQTSDRKDDQDAKTHINRVEKFEKFTKPAIDYMHEKLTVQNFDGLGTIEQISEKIKNSLV